jgi:hypothetical protein
MEKRREIKKNGILNNAMDLLDRKHRNHLQKGFKVVAADSMNTRAKQKIVNRLAYACFGQMKEALVAWKMDTFRKFREEVERKKAKAIDTMIRNNMSPLQKSFDVWRRAMRDAQKVEYGRAVQAGFALYSIFKHKLDDNKINMCRFALRKINWDPIKIMNRAFEKMIRAAGLNYERAWLAWKVFAISRNADMATKARREAASMNFSNLIHTKRKNHLRAGIRRLADGVAMTNA